MSACSFDFSFRIWERVTNTVKSNYWSNFAIVSDFGSVNSIFTGWTDRIVNIFGSMFLVLGVTSILSTDKLNLNSTKGPLLKTLIALFWKDCSLKLHCTTKSLMIVASIYAIYSCLSCIWNVSLQNNLPSTGFKYVKDLPMRNINLFSTEFVKITLRGYTENS